MPKTITLSEGEPMLSGLAERDALRRFAREIMDAWPDGGIEGADLQAIAVKHGLLVPETRHEPCGESCLCAHHVYSDEWPVTCYRRTALLNGD